MKPEIEVNASGPSGNVFAVMANAIRALEETGHRGQSIWLQARLLEAMKEEGMHYDRMLKIISQFVKLNMIDEDKMLTWIEENPITYKKQQISARMTKLRRTLNINPMNQEASEEMLKLEEEYRQL